MCPSPQIEASDMAFPMSVNSSILGFSALVVRLICNNCSCCRIVPMRQGTHCPHDSFLKNSATRIITSRMFTSSPRTMTAPEPRETPCACAASVDNGKLKCSGAISEPAAPQSKTACVVVLEPPARLISSFILIPKSAS